MKKACRACRYIVEGDVCPNCNATDLTKSLEGVIYIVDPNGSEVADAVKAKMPGKYALKIK